MGAPLASNPEVSVCWGCTQTAVISPVAKGGNKGGDHHVAGAFGQLLAACGVVQFFLLQQAHWASIHVARLS
jgi:hypothetical protein